VTEPYFFVTRLSSTCGAAAPLVSTGAALIP
jgi:hypothetical protein